MRKVLVILASILTLTAVSRAQSRLTPGERFIKKPTFEFLFGPQFGSGILRGFDDPFIFEQDLDYSGFFVKTGLTLPVRPRLAFLIRSDFDFFKAEAGNPIPFVGEYELRRTASTLSLGFGFRVELR